VVRVKSINLGVDMNINIFEFNNVTLSPEVVKHGYAKGRLKAHHLLVSTITKLAPMYPLWQFVVPKVHMGDEVNTFEVMTNGQKLGSISRLYHGRDYVVAVTNHRISESRTRGSEYKTKDVDKAVLKVKKTFFPRNPKERLAEAHAEAGRLLNQQENGKARALNNHEYNISAAMMEYVKDIGYAGFLAHLQTLEPRIRDKLLAHIEGEKELRMEIKSIEEIRRQFEKQIAALIVRDSGKYLVRIDDNVQIYDDNTLPESMKRNLGMLKLVDAGFFLSGVGCRVNDEVFVVAAEEKEQA
jgi:predicted  nucleic acid-binding Zn-ribbon protein